MLDAPLASYGEVFVHLLGRVVEPAEIQGWLHLDLDLLMPDLSGRVTFYTVEHDGLTELARDLETGLSLEAGELDRTPIELDGPLVPGVRGLDDLTVLNHALGVLLHRGLTLDAARDELRRRAAETQQTLTHVARAVLGAS